MHAFMRRLIRAFGVCGCGSSGTWESTTISYNCSTSHISPTGEKSKMVLAVVKSLAYTLICRAGGLERLARECRAGC